MEFQSCDVVLFKKYTFHKSCLDPIAKELMDLGVKAIQTSKRHLVYDAFEENNKKKFKIMVIADEWGNLFRDISDILITTGHSMASKNTTLNSKNSIMDYIFCPSQYYKTKFLERGIVPKKEIVVTGYPAASRIFRKEFSPECFWNNFEKEKIKILIAPTYNRDLSIMDALIKAETERNLFERMNEMVTVFKLHPVLFKKYPEHANFVKSLADKYENVYYHDDSHDDISDLVLWSDVVIGDCSGALLLAAAGEVPIFAYDNPNRETSPYYDPDGPEWKFRKGYSYPLNDINIDTLDKLIRYSCSKDSLCDQRKQVVNLLYDHQENAEKVAARKIADILINSQ